jgi:nitroreductase
MDPAEKFVGLIHLGEPVQEQRPPEREPAASVVTYLD